MVNIRGRMNRIESKTIGQRDKWVALHHKDRVNVLFSTGKNITMTPDEFKEWKEDKTKGEIIKIEWVE